MPCSNAAKTRNPLKFAGVPQTTGPISAASGPKFAMLWGHVDDILLLNTLFPIADMCLSCEDIARQSCGMVPRWRLTTFCVLYFQRATCSTFQTCNRPIDVHGRPKQSVTTMWANAQRDGRPAEHRWHPLFNAGKFGWRPLLDAVQ